MAAAVHVHSGTCARACVHHGRTQ